MARRGRPTDLTESWDDVEHDDDLPIYDELDERSELGGSYQQDPRAGASDEDEDEETPRPRRTRGKASSSRNEQPRRGQRAFVEPELVMPSSPDGLRPTTKSSNLRASTPHFRLNQRSMTSDAGEYRLRNMRASTPNARISERVTPSETGRLRRPKSRMEGNPKDPDRSAGLAEKFVIPVARSLLGYVGDIVGLAFRNAKPLLGWLLLAYFIFGALVFGAGFLTNSIHRALTPICRIPGASWLHLPFCPLNDAPELQGPAEFDKLIQVQSAFDDIMGATAVGASLPLDMKRSEASIRDLKHVVEYSSLPSRNELVFEFSGFIETARQASQDLSKFNSRIGRAVDHILSTNRWTLSVIDGVSASEAGRGAVTNWMAQNLNIFAPFQPASLSRDILVDQYLRHTEVVEDQIVNLISEAQALLNILDNLDGRLDAIASIAARDDAKAQDNKEELFAYLWTKLGGNRSSMAKLNQQIELLKNVGGYRRLAWAHVTTTIVKLQEIRNNLEDLRERVAMPEIIGTDKIPLEVHINSINLGIERLEEQRDSTRKLEAENYARVLSRGETGEKRMLEGKKEL